MMIFQKEYELRAADFDRWDRIRPASVLSLFQDVAGIHANELGIGFAALMERKTIWVLTKVRYELVGTPRRYERVRVRTWPLPPARINFRPQREAPGTARRRHLPLRRLLHRHLLPRPPCQGACLRS